MFRRLINAFLVAGGALLLGWALWVQRLGLRRALAVGGLVGLGMVLNLAGATRRTLEMRVWLRVLAVVVGVAALGGVLAMRWAMQQTMESVSPANLAVRAPLSAAVRESLWLAGALVYAIVSVLVLPKCPRKTAVASTPVPGTSE